MRGRIEKVNRRYRVVLEFDAERDPETGERVRQRRRAGTYRTKAEAEAALDDARQRARQGWRGPSRLTLSEYLWDEWLPGVELERASTTSALYRTLMQAYVIPRLGGRRLDSLHTSDLTRLYAELLSSGGRGARPSHPRRCATSTRRSEWPLADAAASRPPHIAFNPAIGAKVPRVAHNKEPRTWSAEQLGTFLQHLSGDRLEALWVLGAATGARRGELLGVRWADLDLEAGEMQVRQVYVAYGKLATFKEPKTEASRRTIPLPPRVLAALKAHRKRQAEEKLKAGSAYEDRGLVFADEIGDPLSPGAVSSSFCALVKAAGLPRLTPHGLRHTYATLGLDAGADVLDVAAILGHSSPAITQALYQHTRPERLRRAAEAIEGAIFG